MRYVIVGLGSIGGTMAALLHESGREVTGVARGAHLEALRRDGLLLRRPEGDQRIELEVAAGVADVELRAGDVVVLAVKSQDTRAVLEQLAAVAPASMPVVCAQNGVANEPDALRWFEHVYGVVVMFPALHLEPGVVIAYSSPTVGILDIGRYPSGEDETSRAIAHDLAAVGFSSRSVPDIARWKFAKLITNLGNAVEVVCGPESRGGPLTQLLQDEARAVLDHSGIAYASDEEDRTRRGEILQRKEVGGPRPGGSLWQSASRGEPNEVDYLCGEIVRLARLAGLPALANATVLRLTHEITRGGRPLGQTPEAEVLSLLGRA